jgi:hypothetical protein
VKRTAREVALTRRMVEVGLLSRASAAVMICGGAAAALQEMISDEAADWDAVGWKTIWRRDACLRAPLMPSSVSGGRKRRRSARWEAGAASARTVVGPASMEQWVSSVVNVWRTT